MPVDARSPVRSVRVSGPSAVTEIASAYYRCSVHPDQDLIPAAAVEGVNDIFRDGLPSFTEPVVLAHATGHLEDPDLDGFVARLREPVRFSGPLALESEVQDERDATNDRLARLARDRRLRTRLSDALQALWTPLRAEWVRTGIARVDAARVAWQARLDRGEDPLALVSDNHCALRDRDLGELVRRARADGTLLVTPSVGTKHLIALPGLVSMSVLVPAEDPVVTSRKHADAIAARLKPLADPTRLTILSQLARTPTSVSELARVMHIAQPTASVHLRQLRDAGLVSATRQGARMVYSSEPEAVTQLLADIGEQLGTRRPART